MLLINSSKNYLSCIVYLLKLWLAGVVPLFPVQSKEIRAMARHCSVGIELRTSVERFILLDTQVCVAKLKKIIVDFPGNEYAYHIFELASLKIALSQSCLAFNITSSPGPGKI